MPDATTAATGLAIAVSRGYDEPTWNTLNNSLYPGARWESIISVLDYCKARHLDPLKKPCHIVPMEVKNARTNTYEWRDVILPGVYELRITAQRTGEYLGHTPATWGPPCDYKGVAASEWCDLTVFRYHPKAENTQIAFPVRVFFREVVTLTRDGKPNARWTRAPLQMLLKCTEAAALREAFPDELGGMHAAEELDGTRTPAADEPAIETPPARALPPKPENFDNWLDDMRAAADEGTTTLRRAWRDSTTAQRDYLTVRDPAMIDTLRHTAAAADRPAVTAPAPATPATPPEPEP